MVNEASCHLSCYTSTHASITTLTFWGHVTSSVARRSTSYEWSIVTMRLSSTVMEICTFKVLPGRLFQEQRSVVGWSVGRSSILH